MLIKEALEAASRYCQRVPGQTDILFLLWAEDYLPHNLRYNGPFMLSVGAYADYLLVKGYLLLWHSGYWGQS